MARREKNAATPALTALARAGVTYQIHRFVHDKDSDDFGAEVVRALGVDAGRVFKTLVVAGPEGHGVAVTPVSRMLDVKKAAAALGWKKTTLADLADAERLTGYVRGGISPFGQRTRLPIVVDASILSWETIFVSAGRRGVDVELTGSDLVAATGAVCADVAG